MTILLTVQKAQLIQAARHRQRRREQLIRFEAKALGRRARRVGQRGCPVHRSQNGGHGRVDRAFATHALGEPGDTLAGGPRAVRLGLRDLVQEELRHGPEHRAAYRFIIELAESDGAEHALHLSDRAGCPAAPFRSPALKSASV